MDARSLKEITSRLSLLYVEDDHNLRKETAKLFGHLFDKVVTVENGQMALDIIKVTPFDLIITDINMPVMDGVTLTRHIRELSPDQTVIITSAHDESHFLMELIELGIDKFILKPLDMQKLIAALSHVCSNIMNEKLVEHYKKEIEASNFQLKNSNDELEILVKVLDTKIKQLSNRDDANQTSSADEEEKAPLAKTNDPVTANNEGLYLFKEMLSPTDLAELKALETDIASEAVLIKLQDVVEAHSVTHIGIMFSRYFEVLSCYPFFDELSSQISTLAEVLQEESDVFVEHSNDILILLDSFLYVLKKWRKALFEEGIKDPQIYNTSMINDIHTIIIILQKDESLVHNPEFF